MKTLTVKINDSAHRRLMNMLKRKRYPSLGDLVAYLIRQENKREFNDVGKASTGLKGGGVVHSTSPRHLRRTKWTGGQRDENN